MDWKRKKEFEGINYIISGESIEDDHDVYVVFKLNDLKTISAIKNKNQILFELLEEELKSVEYYALFTFFNFLDCLDDDYDHGYIDDNMFTNIACSWSEESLLKFVEEIIEKSNLMLKKYKHSIPDWVRDKVNKYCLQAQNFKQKKINRQAKDFFIELRRREFQSLRKDLIIMLINRDDYKCKVCETHDNITVDHIIPLSKGGTDELDNLQLLCRSCNSSKGNK
jgi:hypothetical protein